MGGGSNTDRLSNNYRVSKSWSLIVIMLAAEVWVCSCYLPPLFSFEGSVFSKERPAKRGVTADMHQLRAKRIESDKASLVAYYSLMLVVYTLKRAILRLPKNTSIFLYSWLVLLSLPFVWFAIVNLWHHPLVYRIVSWVVFPITVWFIPTASFLFDRLSNRKVSLINYVIRSFVEQSVFYGILVYLVSFLCIYLGWIVV